MNIEQSFLCYTVGPCWLSIWNILSLNIYSVRIPSVDFFVFQSITSNHIHSADEHRQARCFSLNSSMGAHSPLLEGNVISRQDSKHCSSLYLDRSGGGRVGVSVWCGERLIKSPQPRLCCCLLTVWTQSHFLLHPLALFDLRQITRIFFPPSKFFWECWRRSLLSLGDFLFCFVLFFNFGQGVQLVGSQFPHQGLNPMAVKAPIPNH